jgi:hypothetical protein
MLDEQVREYVTKLGDLELIEYVASSDYQPQAIEFAREEFARRKLDSQQLADLQTKAQANAKVRALEETEFAAEQLGRGGRAIAFVAGMGMFGVGGLALWVAMYHFKDRGQRQKIRDMWRCGWYGFATFIALVFFMIWMHAR